MKSPSTLGYVGLPHEFRPAGVLNLELVDWGYI